VLGSGGWIPTGRRETTCVLVRRGDHALVLDAGTGLRRLVTEPERLDGVTRIDVALTHFHLDHACGLAYLPALPIMPVVHAPGAWLYRTASAELLAPLLSPPISPFDQRPEIRELGERQAIGGFTLTARAQPRHWHPTAGLRVDDALALITDTGYDPGSAELARGVEHLLHEAWLPGDDRDASERDAERVAREAGADRLTLVHLHPRDARSHDGEALL
jgi:ribonuclease BN (tRNA processing enzyme)